MQPVAGIGTSDVHPLSVPGPEMAGGMARFRGAANLPPP